MVFPFLLRCPTQLPTRDETYAGHSSSPSADQGHGTESSDLISCASSRVGRWRVRILGPTTGNDLNRYVGQFFPFITTNDLTNCFLDKFNRFHEVSFVVWEHVVNEQKHSTRAREGSAVHTNVNVRWGQDTSMTIGGRDKMHEWAEFLQGWQGCKGINMVMSVWDGL